MYKKEVNFGEETKKQVYFEKTRPLLYQFTLAADLTSQGLFIT